MDSQPLGDSVATITRLLASAEADIAAAEIELAKMKARLAEARRALSRYPALVPASSLWPGPPAQR